MGVMYSLAGGMKRIDYGACVPLPVGSVVSYGDMANSREKAVVVSDKCQEHGYGQEIIFLHDLHKSQVTNAIIDGPGGWQREKETFELEDVLIIVTESVDKRKRDKIAREKAKGDRDKNAGLSKEFYKTVQPSWAKAVIVGEWHVNKTDTQTDYFATENTKTVVLAWSKHKRDLFPEMRKAAQNCPETAFLATAGKSAEHRERYSMGPGYYLSVCGDWATGWRIKKQVLWDDGIYKGDMDGYCAPEKA